MGAAVSRNRKTSWGALTKGIIKTVEGWAGNSGAKRAARLFSGQSQAARGPTARAAFPPGGQFLDMLPLLIHPKLLCSGCKWIEPYRSVWEMATAPSHLSAPFKKGVPVWLCPDFLPSGQRKRLIFPMGIREFAYLHCLKSQEFRAEGNAENELDLWGPKKETVCSVLWAIIPVCVLKTLNHLHGNLSSKI